jgi:hypothetical protein
MFKKMFSGGATFLCLSLALCAKIGSAQACQSGADGHYLYSAIGTGIPGALLTTSSSSSTSAYSNTPLGQLLAGIANPGPFAASGTLYLDGSGNIRTSSAAQGGTTMLVGTYVVNSDCTIAVTLTDAFGTNTATTTLQGLILAQGSEIDLGVLQNVSAGLSTAIGAYQSNLLVRLSRPLATYCNMSNLNGSYALIATGNRAANVATGSGTVILPAQTVAPFFLLGRVQFDGSGSILSQAATSSSLSFLQFAGSYAVNTDCTGTMTLGSNSSTGTVPTSGTTLSVNFVLTQPSFPGISMRPDIQFNVFNGTETLFGRGQAQ